MKRALRLLAIALVLGGSFLPVHASGNQSPESYDGYWWLQAEAGEKSGFLNGAADCLVWTAHEKWVSHSTDWVSPKIAGYYQTHTSDRAVPIIDVWRKLVSEAPPATPSKGGEVYASPHGYFTGLYWRQSSELERLGFLEGYLSCLRTRVPSPAENYSAPASYYAEKITDYVFEHPETENVAIAAILARFRDAPKQPASTNSVEK